VDECGANISADEGMFRMVDKLRAHPKLEAAIARQDAVASQRILQSVLFPPA
jgi:ABC-type sugar transport system substrate-binding protein